MHFIRYTLLLVFFGFVLSNCGNSEATKDDELADLLNKTIEEKTGYDLIFNLYPTGKNKGSLVITTDYPLELRATSGLILFESYRLLKEEDRSFERYVLNDDGGEPIAALSLEYLKLFEEKHEQSENTLKAMISKDYVALNKFLNPNVFPDSIGIKMTEGFHAKFELMDYEYKGIELDEEGGEKYCMEVYEFEGSLLTITYKLSGSENIFGLHF